MRMVHYFSALALVVAPALLATMITGIWLQGGTTHLAVGLVGALLAVGAQTLLILFMIVTGRVLRAAMESRPLPQEFLGELNAFFSQKRAYPLAGIAALVVTAAAVLGYGNRAFGAHPSIHMLVGLFAVMFNLWALQEGYVALRANQVLIDRTEAELDRIDREAPETIRPEEPELDPRSASRRCSPPASAGPPTCIGGWSSGAATSAAFTWPGPSARACSAPTPCCAPSSRATCPPKTWRRWRRGRKARARAPERPAQLPLAISASSSSMRAATSRYSGHTMSMRRSSASSSFGSLAWRDSAYQTSASET